MDEGCTKILHKAKIMDSLFDACDTEVNRKYFYVLENGYETNKPFWAVLPINTILAFCCLPPCCCGDYEVCSNSVCRGTDHVKRVYFDRGEYDERDCIHCLGLVSGRPRTIPRGMQYVLCCMDVPDCCEWWYGEQISVVPYETCCFCIPNSSNYLTNCGNLCGPRLGEPICTLNIAIGLAKGEGLAGQTVIETARKEWEERVKRAR